MREILFRGQLRKKGEKVNMAGESLPSVWIYGLLSIYSEERGRGLIVTQELEKFPVYAETIGQFTGLTDKNGRKIFEDDIVRLYGDKDNSNTKLIDYTALVVFKDGGYCAIDGTPDNYCLRRYDFAKCDLNCVVIGNIHDNPELLEGE